MLNTFNQIKERKVRSGGSYRHFVLEYWAKNPEYTLLPSSDVKANLNLNNNTLTEQM